MPAFRHIRSFYYGFTSILKIHLVPYPDSLYMYHQQGKLFSMNFFVCQWNAICDDCLSFKTLSSSSDINFYSSPFSTHLTLWIISILNFALFSPLYSVHKKNSFILINSYNIWITQKVANKLIPPDTP